MDNLRSVLSIVLSKIPPREILRNKIYYNDITKETFIKLAGYYVKNYSNDELDNLYSYIQNEYEDLANHFKGYWYTEHDQGERNFNIFEAILIFAVRVLTEKNGEPVCHYEHLLRWRMTAHELDEDLFSTAFLAYEDIYYINPYRNFAWRPVLKHNNDYLNRILAEGMADNHFHLKGSAPQFPLSWLSIMNNVVSNKNRRIIESYSDRRLSTIYFTGEDDDHLYISCLKAALIRCFLFAKLTGRKFYLFKKVDLIKDKEISGKEEITEEIVERISENKLKELLESVDEILFYRKEIQENISFYKYDSVGCSKILDYALLGNNGRLLEDRSINQILSGERWFLYRMFQNIFSGDEELEKYYNYFYAYLVIKGTLRSELVQTNTNIGFDNFAKYQDRKEDFIEKTPFEKVYLQLSVKGTLENENIRCLESRITPKTTAYKNMKYIQHFDHAIDKKGEWKKNYFYVFHFVKEKDDPKLIASDDYCRHYKKRLKLRKQAEAIMRMREEYLFGSERVKGIDACAKEIGCRPEVFAQTYRFLGSHIVYHSDKYKRYSLMYNRPMQVEQLGKTYHIGEDYLDIVDGLRAIDEAVHFLQLDCGSRLGHALALGTDVEEYYQVKKNRILISQQDYLDNIVWMYYRVKKFRLDGYEPLLLHLEQEYEKYFRIIYGNFVCDDYFKEMIHDAREYFRETDYGIVKGYCNSHFNFRMATYYSAWKLRGDNPQYYENGYFKNLHTYSEWDRYAVNRTYPSDYKIRYNPECAYLYYLYHYCGKAKKEGQKVIEVKVGFQFVQCVKEIQNEMKKWIAKCGIGIETNPSSNYLIGTFRRYDRHPIFDFYNLGLTSKVEKIEDCPQIPVCINTDDQGIFSTYLENEYGLLVLALEKRLDDSGRKKYKRAQIYQWVDNVRKMGLYMSFGENRKGEMREEGYSNEE